MEVNRTLRFGWKRPTKPHVSLRRSLKRFMDMYIQLFLHVRKAAKLQLSSLHVSLLSKGILLYEDNG